MASDLLIYGSYGYAGSLITHRAVERGLDPVLGGRSTAPLERQATEFGVDREAFTLEYPSVVDRRLEGVDAVLNCAGPFSATAEPLIESCLRTGTDYLDLAGRIEVLEAIADRNDDAEEEGITLLPAVGFDVVPTDCLAVYLADEEPEATTLRIALDGMGSFSPGTVKSIIEGLDRPGAVREDGAIRAVPMAYRTREFPFHHERKRAVTVPWGDVSTAFYATDIPNIETYATVPPGTLRLMELGRPLTPALSWGPFQALLQTLADYIVSGPTAAERARRVTHIYAEVETPAGDRTAATLRTPDTYDVTAATAVDAAEQTLDGAVAPGFQTAGTAFGAEYVLKFEEVERKDVEPADTT